MGDGEQLDVVALTRALVDIDSTSGRETEAGVWLAAYLRGRGFAVREQAVDGQRFNVYAAASEVAAPAVVLSTHFDCVPPFFPSRVEGDRIYGRGSCDAKGILAAQITAAERLRASGCRVGLLFVVGEERGSDGAAAANAMSVGSAFLVNGEPTDNRLALSTRGVLRVRLSATGRAAHSSYPELGESAIEKLLDALVALRGIALPEDAVMGRTHYTVGLIDGGVAPNVVPPAASAEVLFRTVGDADTVRGLLEPLCQWVGVDDVLEVPPVRLHVVDGYETASFPYTTDIPLLSNWGTPLLYGPGSVLVAHTAEEYVTRPSLDRAVDDYVRLVERLGP